MKKLLLLTIPSMLIFASIVIAATTEYGASVVSSLQGQRKDGSAVLPARSDPNQALNLPNGVFFSLGFGGTITISFANYVGTNLSISTHEITNGTYPLETANVEVSQNGTSWTSVGTANNQNGSGPNPHTTTFSLPSGTCIKYVRITDTSDPRPFSNDADGFDLDAISTTYDSTCTPCCGGDIIVKNRNRAVVTNNVTVVANTGGNVAAGGSGGNGGSTGSTIAVSGSCCQEHSVTIVSDTTNTVQETAGNAVSVSFIHPAWTASIPGATWIWAVDPVANPTQNEYSTFEKQFNVVGSVTSAILDIASDNSYEVWLNNTPVGADASENNFSLAGQDQYTASVVSALQSGTNTIKIKVKNWALGGGTPRTNPAGLLYKLVVNSEECSSSTAIGGNAGGGGGGGNGGTIITGTSKTKSKVINVVNTNITRIRR